jgi:GT2 family glycosyltransferase
MEELQAPRVTALVVSRNNAERLRRCLEHLEASSDRERLEILVVDDGSHDGTSDVVFDFPSVISLRMPKRLGWTRAVNIGLRTAKGDLILLIGPEALVAPDMIARLADRLEASADTGAVCPATPAVWPFPSPTALTQAWKTGDLPGGRPPGEGEVAVDYPKNSPIMVRRELLRAMNYLDNRFGHAWSDLEMCWRIRSGGKTIVVLSDVRVDTPPAGRVPVEPIEWVDSAHGIATWIGLHHGTVAGLQFRLGAALTAVGRGKLGAAGGILTGQKIDGNQE